MELGYNYLGKTFVDKNEKKWAGLNGNNMEYMWSIRL